MNLKQRLEAQNNRAQLVTGLGGEGGGILEAGTTTRNGEFKAIQVLNDAVFGTVAGNIAGLTGASVSAGHVIHGLFTSVTLASGAILIYRS